MPMLLKERFQIARVAMRLAIPALILIAMFGFIAALAPRVRIVHAGPNCDADTTLDSQEDALLNLINEYRADNGVGPLVFSDTLNQAAAWKSEHMATNSYFGHDDEGLNRDFVERLRDCDYTANTWLAENIAAGNASATGTFEQWRASPGHNSNMLNPNMVAIGVARVFQSEAQFGWYWTAEFGGVADGSTVPPPASLPDKTGDVNCNGDTTSLDAALVLQFDAALLDALPCEIDADMNGDGSTTSVDAAIILQLTAGLLG
jgi:uncharacterized protein YkwD